MTHPLQPYWDLVLASIGADCLRLALEWHLFELLPQHPTAAALAERLGCPEATLQPWLEQLWTLGLLDREPTAPACYRNTAVAETYLHAAAPGFCGDAWRLRLANARQLGAALETRLQNATAGAPPADQQAAWARAAQLQIVQEQRACTAPVAVELLTALTLPETGRLLDLGGGPGGVAIALAQARPQWQATVFDYPAAVDVAVEHIQQAELSERVRVVGGDLAHDDLGGAYDLIWCSSVLHFVPDLHATLTKILTALKPGGRLISVHAQRADDGPPHARVSAYYLPLRLQGRFVPRPGELEAALQEAGFIDIDDRGDIDFPLAPARVLLARRGP